MTSRRNNDGDALGDAQRARELGGQWAKWGTVGWPGDATRADVASLGDGTDGDEGRTLVNVTLFSGRDITRRPVQGVAQGRQIRAQLSWPLTVIPPVGMQVLVIFPDGDMESAGNGILVCGAAPSRPAGVAAPLAVDRGTLDVGGDYSLAVMGLSVTLLDHSGDAAGSFASWLCVGKPKGQPTPGIYASDGAGGGLTIGSNAAGLYVGDGSGGVAAMIQLGGPSSAAPGAGIVVNNSGFLNFDTEGAINLSGQSCGIGTGTISLGANATPATPVLLGVTGIAGVGSLTIFGQP